MTTRRSRSRRPYGQRSYDTDSTPATPPGRHEIIALSPQTRIPATNVSSRCSPTTADYAREHFWTSDRFSIATTSPRKSCSRYGDAPAPATSTTYGALLEHYSQEQLFELAKEKDAGFSVTTFIDALNAINRLSSADWAEDGIESSEVLAIMAAFADWRSRIASELNE
jgi:hypothetical protein